MTQPPTPDLTLAYHRLLSLLLDATSLDQFLQQLADLAPTAVTEESISCGITTRRDGQPLTVASSDGRAIALDESQYAVQQGPCLHTLDTGMPVVIDDVDHDTRWRDYLANVTPTGLRSSLSLPLTVGNTTIGAMNLYGFGQPHLFTGPVRHRCELFAAQASGALQLSIGRTTDRETLLQLNQALASRSIIDQAIGILMAQQQCPADQAFALLRMRSQNTQQKLRDVAADLITRVSGQPPQPAKPFDPS